MPFYNTTSEAWGRGEFHRQPYFASPAGGRIAYYLCERERVVITLIAGCRLLLPMSAGSRYWRIITLRMDDYWGRDGKGDYLPRHIFPPTPRHHACHYWMGREFTLLMKLLLCAYARRAKRGDSYGASPKISLHAEYQYHAREHFSL